MHTGRDVTVGMRSANGCGGGTRHVDLPWGHVFFGMDQLTCVHAHKHAGPRAEQRCPARHNLATHRQYHLPHSNDHAGKINRQLHALAAIALMLGSCYPHVASLLDHSRTIIWEPARAWQPLTMVSSSVATFHSRFMQGSATISACSAWMPIHRGWHRLNGR